MSNNNAEILKLALATHAASLDIKSIEGVPHALVPSGYQLQNLETLLPHPIRTKRNRMLADAKSFIDYWQKFAINDSVIFCNENDKKITAVFDYDTPETPGWEHTQQR